jgi:ribosomal protein S18 acetylase RimI-like enzyme
MGKKIEYNLINDGVDFNVVAQNDAVEIGSVQCDREGDHLTLADIWVSEQKRRKGIGGELLKRLVEAADNATIRLIVGSIMPDAIREQPFLLAWYERHGFRVMPPDSTCLRGAAKRIGRSCGVPDHPGDSGPQE